MNRSSKVYVAGHGGLVGSAIVRKLQSEGSKPDGTPRKLLDVTRLNSLGWRHAIPLRDGIENTYAWYCREQT